MIKPKMIIFDYGQTLIDEVIFDPVAGNQGVLDHATDGKETITAEELNDIATELNHDIKRWGIDYDNQINIEVHNEMFTKYLYEIVGVNLTKSFEEVGDIFWNHATKPEATQGIKEFLAYLGDQGIRTAVISNLSFSGRALTDRINRYIPTHKFEFIMSSSEYVFRKPHPRIFQMAIKKSGLAAEEIWYCGDQPYYDVDGSSAVGMQAVWYKGAYKHRVDYEAKHEAIVVEKWIELKAYIENL